MNRRKVFTFFLSLLIHGAVLAVAWIFLHNENLKPTASSARHVQLSLSDFITTPQAAPSSKSSSHPEKSAVPPIKPTPVSIPKPTVKPRTAPQKSVQKKGSLSRSSKRPKKRVAHHIKRKRTSKKKAFKADKSSRKKASTPTRALPASKPKPPKPSKKTSPLSQLASALGAPANPSPPRPAAPSIDQINRAFSKKTFYALYKDEFDRFSPTQRKFIENNLARIQGITQHYLTQRGYPPFAGEMGQQGTNVVEFYLLPNGDITGLKIITPTGFEQLDQNSIDTIKTAYKDYPHPKEKTKIRFYIHYSIY